VGQSLLQVRESRAHPESERGHIRRNIGIGDGAAYLLLVAFLQGQVESDCQCPVYINRGVNK
jgi:hypothetical protein